MRQVAGRLDRLLNGEASRFIRQGKFSGKWRSQAMIASRGRIAPRYVLFAGLGKLRTITTKTHITRLRDVVLSSLKTSTRNFSMTFSEPDGLTAQYEDTSAEVLGVLLPALAEQPHDVDLVICESNPKRYDHLVETAEEVIFRSKLKSGVSLEVVL
ncbi:MAG: hypothetical protein O2807_05395 [bacterium]|nr:hypothetical protein [bacterium]